MLKKISDKKRKWKFFLFFKANFSADFSPLGLIFTVFFACTCTHYLICKIKKRSRVSCIAADMAKKAAAGYLRRPCSRHLTKGGNLRPSNCPLVIALFFNFIRGFESPPEVWLRAGTASCQPSTVKSILYSEAPLPSTV